VDTLWVFLHLPKTGGTTFSGHLAKNFEFDEEFIHLGPWGDGYRRRQEKLPWHKRPIEEREKARVLSGHNTYYGVHNLVPSKLASYITTIRDPVDRLVSYYNFHFGRYKNDSPMEVLKGIGSGMAHYYSKWLSCGGYKKRYEADPLELLGKLYYIATQETLDEDLSLLFEEIGCPKGWKNYRVAGEFSQLEDINFPRNEDIKKAFTPTQAQRCELKEVLKSDYAIYERALKKRKEILERRIQHGKNFRWGSS